MFRNRTSRLRLSALIAVAFLTLSCDGVTGTVKSRPYYLGFTPWPYDITEAAVEETYRNIGVYADLICHHIDDGVPWPEALNGEPYHPNVQADIESRLNHTPHGHKVYLSVGMLGPDRYGLAGYWAEESNGEMPPGWQGKTFDDPEVIAAYTNYCRYMIDAFDPDYFAYGIEVNANFTSSDTEFPGLMTLISDVYTSLKGEYPSLPIFLSLIAINSGKDPTEFYATTKQMLAYSDYVAVSTYPFWEFILNVTGDSDPDKVVEADWLSAMAELDPKKPFAVAETGYIAEDLTLNDYGVNIEGTEEWQARYVEMLFDECERLDARFIVWFCVRDYDQLWEYLEGEGFDEFFKTWRDTGLIDGDGNPRKALKVWDAGLAGN